MKIYKEKKIRNYILINIYILNIFYWNRLKKVSGLALHKYDTDIYIIYVLYVCTYCLLR